MAGGGWGRVHYLILSDEDNEVFLLGPRREQCIPLISIDGTVVGRGGNRFVRAALWQKGRRKHTTMFMERTRVQFTEISA